MAAFLDSVARLADIVLAEIRVVVMAENIESGVSVRIFRD